MSLEVAIKENTEALNKLIAIMGAQPQPERKIRAEKPAMVETPAQKTEETAAPETVQPARETPVNLEQIQAAVTKLAAGKGRDAAVALLKQYQATRASDLDFKYYDAFVQAVNATLMVA